MSKEGIAITAMYMALGANDVLDLLTEVEYQDLIDHHSGHVGFMGVLSEFALLSEQYIEDQGFDEYPGIYEYEVSRPFGAWYAQHWDEAPMIQVAKLREMQDEFFEVNLKHIGEHK